VVTILERLPPDLWKDAAYDVCRLIRSLAPQHRLGDRLLALWDCAWPVASKLPVTAHSDRIATAASHPCGSLAESLAVIAAATSPKRDSGLPEAIRTRLTDIVGGPGEVPSVARVELARLLRTLHYIDPGWTREHLLPFFEWGRGPQARDCWEGFLWSPSLDMPLFADLKPMFLDTFRHYSDIEARWRRPLPGLLVAAAIEPDSGMSPEEGRRCLEFLDDAGRAAAADRLSATLRDAGPRAAAAWRERIGPLFGTLWPRSREAKGPEASRGLFRIAMSAGKAFPEAAEAIRGLLVPAAHADMLWSRLAETSIPDTYPEECLSLIDAATPVKPSYQLQGLGAVLARLARARPRLTDDVRFRTLQDRTIQAGYDPSSDDAPDRSRV
jgi:hypothetical protein